MADNGFKINKSVNLNPQTAVPANPIDGDIYYNSTIGSFVYYHGGAWASLDSIGAVVSSANMTSALFIPSVVQNSVVRLTGSGGNLHGMASSFSAKSLTFYNQTSSTVIIKYESATEATANNRIITPTGGDLNLISGEIATFMYDVVQNRWLMVSLSSNAGAAVVSTTTNNGIVTLHQASATPSTPKVLTDGDLNTATGVVGLDSNKTATITSAAASGANALTVTGDGAGAGIAANGGPTGVAGQFISSSVTAILSNSTGGAGLDATGFNAGIIGEATNNGANVAGVTGISPVNGVLGECQTLVNSSKNAGVIGTASDTNGHTSGVLGKAGTTGQGIGVLGLGGSASPPVDGEYANQGGYFIGGASGFGAVAQGGSNAAGIHAIGGSNASGAVFDAGSGNVDGSVSTGSGTGSGTFGVAGNGAGATGKFGIVGYGGHNTGALGTTSASLRSSGVFGLGKEAGAGVIGTGGNTGGPGGRFEASQNVGNNAPGIMGIGFGTGNGGFLYNTSATANNNTDHFALQVGNADAGGHVFLDGGNPSSTTAFTNVLTQKNTAKVLVHALVGTSVGTWGASVSDGFNVTSVTRISGTTFRITFASSFANTLYTPHIHLSYDSGGSFDNTYSPRWTTFNSAFLEFVFKNTSTNAIEDFDTGAVGVLTLTAIIYGAQ